MLGWRLQNVLLLLHFWQFRWLAVNVRHVSELTEVPLPSLLLTVRLPLECAKALWLIPSNSNNPHRSHLRSSLLYFRNLWHHRCWGLILLWHIGNILRSVFNLDIFLCGRSRWWREVFNVLKLRYVRLLNALLTLALCHPLAQFLYACETWKLIEREYYIPLVGLLLIELQHTCIRHGWPDLAVVRHNLSLRVSFVSLNFWGVVIAHVLVVGHIRKRVSLLP